MNRKGQALVEFVLILPIFVLILLVIVDFGNILVTKNKLENDASDIVRIIRNNDDIVNLEEEYPNINIEVIDYKDKYKKITLTSEVKINTFFLDKILGDPFVVNTERVISYE